MPSRTTVAEACHAEAETGRAQLVESINTYVKRYGIVGVTTDMWQEEYKKKNFVAVTVHMLDSEKNGYKGLNGVSVSSRHTEIWQ